MIPQSLSIVASLLEAPDHHLQSSVRVRSRSHLPHPEQFKFLSNRPLLSRYVLSLYCRGMFAVREEACSDPDYQPSGAGTKFTLSCCSRVLKATCVGILPLPVHQATNSSCLL